MKALLNLKSAINQSTVFGIIALVSLLPVLVPASAFAADQTSSQQAQIFKIQNSTKINSAEETPAIVTVTQPSQNSLSIEEVQSNDTLSIKLKQYLEKHNSPLAEYSAEIVKQPQWERALAISWVESNFGRRCADNNCSGIGVEPGHRLWRKYPTKLDWFKDMSALMEKPIYKEKYKTFRQMKGVYVSPGTENWVRGAEVKYAALTNLKLEAEAEQREMAQINKGNEELHTFAFAK